MASAIPVANTRNAAERSKSRRIGALLDLSRGEPPLSVMRRNVQKEPQKSMQPAPASSRTRAQTSRIPQSPPAYKPSTEAEVRGPRPPLTHETQSWSTASRSGIPMAKPTATVGGYVEPSKRPRNVLRRKQSTMLREPSNIYAQKPSRLDSSGTGSSSSITNPQVPLDPIGSLSDRSATQSPGEIPSPLAVETHRPTAQPAQIYPELDRYRDIIVPPSRDQLGRDALYRLATEDLPPPTPQFSGTSSHSLLSSFSASPSTRFSGSPGPGPYSRDTTPTSMCSQSPGLVAPMRLPATRLRQASPAETRPPVTRRRAGSISNEGGSFSSDPQGLAAVREALTSSSSNSTVRAEEKKNGKAHRRPAPEPPNPPPRKSSQKFQKGRSVDEKQPPRNLSQQTMRSPSPAKLTKSARNRAPSVASSPQRRPTPPSRPSRDGTPDLYSQFGGPVPIIHSNLSSTSLTEKRQSGQLQPSSLPKTITLRSSQDRPGSARPSFSQESTQAPRTGILPGPQVSKNDVENINSTSGSGMSTFKSKFPLFGRRTKASTEVAQIEKKRDKIPRKGPAAGTGHEGYGRVGAVRRRSSATSTFQRGLPGPLSSAESLATTLSTDPFLLERMSPVIIAGGEVVENHNNGAHLIRTQSNQSIPWSRPSLDSRSFSAASPSTIEDNRQTLWPSPIISETNNPRRPSESSDAEDGMMKSTFAYGRPTRGLETRDNASFSIPKTIDNRAPSVASMATTIHTDDSFPDIQSEQSRVLPKVTEPAKKLTKRAKSPRKWTLFGRSETSLSSKKETESISATVQPSLNKPPAFYTIMDSPKQEDVNDRQDMDYLSNGIEGLPAAEIRLDYGRRPSTGSVTKEVIHARPEEDMTNIRSKTTGVIPQIWQLDTKQEHRRVEQTPPQSSVGRPSRLPQVGRIPKVVASRPEQISPKSFSRPFNRISVQLLPAPSTRPDQDSIAKGPSPPESVALTSIDTESSTEATSYGRSKGSQTGHSNLSLLGQPNQEFLAFTPSDNSEGVESSESSYSGRLGYAAHIAQVPEPSAPFGEDEVWDEYNDLLQDAPPSPTSSCGDPFPLETYNSKLVKKLVPPLESPTIMTGAAQDSRASVVTAKAVTTSSHYSEDMTARIHTASEFDSEPPVTPFSVSEFVSGYSDRNSNKVEPNQESPAPLRNSSSSHGSEKDQVSSKRSSETSNRTSGSSRLSEETPLSQVNLRVGSMTVSKWLTFGHVLFSPIREDLVDDDSSLKRQSILIIDGLGNDDWSFYAAETYPATNFFNLSPRAPLLQEHRKTPSFPLSPPNHHQIQFMSYADKFPFGPDSFTALVFRFPSAAPEAHYRRIISEAQRVIKPGGFIELSILDIDLNNVGGRTRRAVRRLKERVSAQNPDFNLSSAADLILRLLGQNGFVDIKTCRVGVPVASSITNASNKEAKKDERSLAEMMNDNTETGDANIAKMVSKVGRWWYNKCYEVPTGMSSSIWRDRALLAECEEWGTSLKLMVCHAKVPEAKGRVVSV